MATKAKLIFIRWNYRSIGFLMIIFKLSAPILATQMCVSSEAVYEMREGPSVGEAEQPSPSNRLYAALL
jgi:hypothetical protein